MEALIQAADDYHLSWKDLAAAAADIISDLGRGKLSAVEAHIALGRAVIRTSPRHEQIEVLATEKERMRSRAAHQRAARLYLAKRRGDFGPDLAAKPLRVAEARALTAQLMAQQHAAVMQAQAHKPFDIARAILTQELATDPGQEFSDDEIAAISGWTPAAIEKAARAAMDEIDAEEAAKRAQPPEPPAT